MENTMKPTIYAPFLGLVALAACNNLYSPSNTPPPPNFTTFRAEGGDATLSATITDLSAGGTNDLVVMDDFVYGEPQPLP
jgi:hypothetical protein